MSPRDKAIDLLQHYFQTAFEAAGLSWDHDHASEIEEAVDLLIEAAAIETGARDQ